MSPTAAIPEGVLRDIGPDEKQISEAGSIAAQLGAHNRGQELIQAMARAHPKEVQRAQSRPVDLFRSAYLVRSEIEERVLNAWGDKLRVLGFDVRGDTSRPEEMDVIVLFEANGRTARGVLRYSECERSIAAYEAALTGERFDPYVVKEDRTEHAKQVARARGDARRDRKPATPKPQAEAPTEAKPEPKADKADGATGNDGAKTEPVE